MSLYFLHRSDCLCYRFNPDFAKYGFAQWPGGLAHNAYNASELEPYTGRLKISDYLDDLQFPQMLDLALKYDTEIMVRFSSFVQNVVDRGSDATSSGAILVDRTERWSLPLHFIIMLGPRAGRLLSTTVSFFILLLIA